jgi:hypothetical protein
MIVAVGSYVSGPDHHTTQGGRWIVRLNEGESLAGRQRRCRFDPGSMVGEVNRHSRVTCTLVALINHQHNSFSDGFPFRPPGGGRGIRCHAEEGIQQSRLLQAVILADTARFLECQAAGQ